MIRRAIFRDLAQIAGYLCAELVLPPPSEVLDKRHKFDKEVAGRTLNGQILKISHSLKIAFQSSSHPVTLLVGSWRDIPLFDNSTKYNQWLHVISTDGKVRKDIDRIQNFFLRQKGKNPTSKVGFVWEIHGERFDSDLWKSKLPMLSREIRDVAQNGYRHAIRKYLHRYYALRRKNHIVPHMLEGCKYTSDNTKSFM